MDSYRKLDFLYINWLIQSINWNGETLLRECLNINSIKTLNLSSMLTGEYWKTTNRTKFWQIRKNVFPIIGMRKAAIVNFSPNFIQSIYLSPKTLSPFPVVFTIQELWDMRRACFKYLWKYIYLLFFPKLQITKIKFMTHHSLTINCSSPPVYGHFRKIR